MTAQGGDTPGTDERRPEPGAKRRAMAAEQAHIDAVHDRVDALREQALRRLARITADRSGSTFQATYERDVSAYHQARRASRFTFGDEEGLVFGRIDRADGEALHIGRVSVTDEEHDVLLVDWRAPAAADFYRATAANPHGVARRRTLTTRGRRLVDLDDEIIDAEAAEELGLEAVTGQGALLAALTRARTGRMRDIAATIQADQDRIIRRPASGTLIVTGGPGTGKTVVALHRVAYLLYTNRERYERRGVLVVGPTATFTRYIGNVLPSLGEERAALKSLDRFVPGFDAAGWDDPEVAAAKGTLAMARLCRNLVAVNLPEPVEPLRIVFEGTAAVLPPDELREVRDRIWERTRPADAYGQGGYHARRDAMADALLDRLWRVWRTARRSEHRPLPEERLGSEFDSEVRDEPELERTVEHLWPVLDAADLVHRLTLGDPPVATVAPDGMPARDVALLERVWTAASRGPTVDDVALADEVANVLGPVPERSRGQRRESGIHLATEQDEVWVELPDVNDPGYRDFAHVVVDEAQDLSPMQWRMVARHAPQASWTVVGDLAQRSRTSEPATWQAVAGLIGRRQVAIERLTVNYRTPAEVMELARTVLTAAGADPADAPDAVRETGRAPRLVETDDVLAVAADQAVTIGRRRDGVLAIVAPDGDVATATARLEDAVDLAGDEHRADLVDRIRVFDPRTVKGLEFDAVVVAHPDRIAAGSSVGLHQLYVVVTRTTDELVLVTRPGAAFPGRELAVSESPEGPHETGPRLVSATGADRLGGSVAGGAEPRSGEHARRGKAKSDTFPDTADHRG